MNWPSKVIIAGLFLALNFDAVVQAEGSGAIPSIGGRYFGRRVEIRVPAFAQEDPGGATFGLGHPRTRWATKGVR